MARPDDELPEIEVVDAQRASRTEVQIETAPRRPFAPWLVGMVVIAVLAAVVGISGRGDGSTDDAGPSRSTSTTTSTTSRSTTTRSTTTTRPAGEFLTGSPEPVLGESVGASVLLGTRSGSTWRQLNLDNGWIEEIPELRGIEGWSVVPAVNGIMAFIPQSNLLHRISLPAVGPEQLTDRAESELQVEDIGGFGRATQLLPAGRPDRFWILSEGPTGPGTTGRTAVLIDPSGSQLAVIDSVPAWPSAASELGLFFNAGGNAFLVNEDGVSGLGPGTVRAANGTFAARIRCDNTFMCVQEIVNVPSGMVTTGGVTPAEFAVEFGVFTMTQAADGSVVAAPNPDSYDGSSSPSPDFYVVTADGRSLATSAEDHRSIPLWLPEDTGLLAVTDRGIARYTIDRDGLESHLIPGIEPEGASHVFVIPHRGLGPET